MLTLCDPPPEKFTKEFMEISKLFLAFTVSERQQITAIFRIGGISETKWYHDKNAHHWLYLIVKDSFHGSL